MSPRCGLSLLLYWVVCMCEISGGVYTSCTGSSAVGLAANVTQVRALAVVVVIGVKRRGWFGVEACVLGVLSKPQEQHYNIPHS